MQRSILKKWLLPAGVLVTFIGYCGPWINHSVAGLVIMGLDLGEYVKFLPSVRSGQISLWREGFYLPLLTISLVSSLYAFARYATTFQHRYHWILRVLFVIMAIVAALNMLPPAWTPGKLRLPEFQLQVSWILLCLAMILVSPFLGLLRHVVRAGATTLLALCSLWFPLSGFLRILPTISELYNSTQRPGWGMYVMTMGLLLLIAGAWATDATAYRASPTQKLTEEESRFLNRTLGEKAV